LETAPDTKRRSSESERRQVTVMFCDLVGSTELSERLDPEDLSDMLASYHKLCAEIIEDVGGSISQYLGDGVLAYFGYPTAHEDDPIRAVHSALRLTERIPHIRLKCLDQHNWKLACRIGVHTGPVVAGEVGAGERREWLALGKTPNIAARLQSLAEVNQVVFSEDTYILLEGMFECESLGKRQLKGISRSMDIYRALGASGARTRFDSKVQSNRTPFVGRIKELDYLKQQFERALKGSTVLLSVTGEAGIGKSRLIEAFNQVVSKQHIRWITARCSPYNQHTAFEPVVELLSRELGFNPGDSPDTKLKKIMTKSGNKSLALFPLGIPLGNNAPNKGLSPKLLKTKAMNAFADWLDSESQGQTLIFVIEDVHWADPSTQSLLQLIINQPTKSSRLVLTTGRPNMTEPWPPGTQVQRLHLGSLPPEDVSIMIKQLSHSKNLPDQVLNKLIQRADGIPIFVEELTKTVMELQESSLSIDPSSKLQDQVDVPSTLHGALMARLDRVASGRELVQLAAVLGRTFHVDQLRAITPLVDNTFDQVFNKLIESNLIHSVHNLSDPVYTFKHSMVQEIAYESILKRKRRLCHKRIASLLENRYPDVVKSSPEILGRHWEKAHTPSKAVPYYQQAANRAKDVYANEEAISFYRKCLDQIKVLLDEQDAPKWRKRQSITYEQLGDVFFLCGQFESARDAYTNSLGEKVGGIDKARLHRKMGDTWETFHQKSEAMECYQRGEHELNQIPRGQNVAWHVEWCKIQIGKISLHYWKSELEQMEALIEKVRPVLNQYGDPSLQSRFYMLNVSYRMRAERFSISKQTLQDAQALIEVNSKMDDLSEKTLGTSTGGIVSLLVNQLDNAEHYLQSALDMTRKTGEAYMATICQTYLSLVYRRSGRLEKTYQAATQGLEIAQRYQMHDYVGTSHANLAWVAWRRGEIENGRQHSHEALDAWGQSQGNYPLFWTALFPRMAINLAEGDVKSAVQDANRMMDADQQELPGSLSAPLNAAVNTEDENQAKVLLEQALNAAIAAQYL